MSLTVVPTSELFAMSRPGWTGHAHARFDSMQPGDVGYLELGPLRLCALDHLVAGTGIDMHRHEDTEIVTLLLDGALEHEDTTGVVTRLAAASVATTAAGSGIEHAERATNAGDVRCLQIWLEPRTRGRTPSFAKRALDLGPELTKLASGSDPAAMFIDSDADVWAASMSPASTVTHTLRSNRAGYLVCPRADVMLGDRRVRAGERALITGPAELEVRALGATELLLLDLCLGESAQA